MSKKFRCLLVLMFGPMFIGHAFANDPRIPTMLELRTLPPYCGPRIGELTFAHYPPQIVTANAPAAKMWKQRFGAANYSHLHHYCFGLNYINRARFMTNKVDRRHALTVAINNFNYVIKRWKPNFELYSSAKAYKHQAELMLSTAS